MSAIKSSQSSSSSSFAVSPRKSNPNPANDEGSEVINYTGSTLTLNSTSTSQRRDVQNFVLAEFPSTSDELLKTGKVTSVDISYVYNDEEGCYQNAIHMSSLYENRLNNLKYLLTCMPPVNLNSQDSDGFTALRSAVSNNNYKALKLLLDFGADRELSNNAGKTPLEEAEIRGKKETAKLLREYFPSRDDMLNARLDAKKFIDKMLENSRFNQGPIDIFYSAVKEEIDLDFKKLSDNGQLSSGGGPRKRTELVQIETERLRLEAEKASLKEERLRMEVERRKLKEERVRWEFEKVKLEIEREAWEEERARWEENNRQREQNGKTASAIPADRIADNNSKHNNDVDKAQSK